MFVLYKSKNNHQIAQLTHLATEFIQNYLQ